MEALLIEKEEIDQYHFGPEDVLSSPEARSHRLYQLNKAVALGNLEKHKVTLHFETREGPRAVCTTIWAAAEDYVLLKRGAVLPTRAIRSIEY